MIKEKTYFFDMFSGIGGFALAAYNTGLRFDGHYFSEIDEYAVELYKKRFPNAISLGDIRGIDYEKLPKGKWLVTGGFPCQPHSLVRNKKRGGEQDKRNLWPECVKVMRNIRPEVALFENVTGLFSSDGGRFYNKVLSEIHESGYDAEWQVISAQEVGAIHKRERVWIVANPSSARLHGIAIQKRIDKKENNKNYKEWEQFYSLSYRNYKIANWEKFESRFCRDDDGIPSELDRFRCIGNAIVPQCAERIMSLPAFDLWRVAHND
jgi:DNA (cytosine-5)-methyltransferase 1